MEILKKNLKHPLDICDFRVCHARSKWQILWGFWAFEGLELISDLWTWAVERLELTSDLWT
jgi:hypothetical protein